MEEDDIILQFSDDVQDDEWLYTDGFDEDIPYDPFDDIDPNPEVFLKLKEKGENEGWWPKTPKDNPKLYLNYCVIRPPKFSSDWLDVTRRENPCPECKGTGRNMFSPGSACPLCESSVEWISIAEKKYLAVMHEKALKKILGGLKVFCPKCKNTATKYGNAKYEQINYGQRYMCTKCRKQFVFLNLYKKEVCKENVAKLFYSNNSIYTIEKKTNISRKTVRKWIIEWLGALPVQK